ncbi:DJ-1 family glyoxalase III [Anaerococcus sp. ENR1011]|uniref:DJ-1 family glyoxalase III n=1 Tax=Anaerococcus groningensis TaxID=3115616 RepID=A0ABW9N034_9FIRM
MKILVFLANGCEDVEAITVIDYLRRADIDVTSVSIHDTNDIITKSNITLTADTNLNDIDPKESDGLYIPGGTKGAEALRDDDRVIDIVKTFNDEEKLIAAICAGPIVLNKAGVLADKRATSFPDLKDDIDNVLEYVDDQMVVTDGNITTSRGAAVTVYLAMRLVEIIKGAEAVEELKHGTQLECVEDYYGISYDYLSNDGVDNESSK